MLALLATTSVSLSSGCASGPEKPEAEASGLDVPAESQRLYQAILDVYEARSWAVDVASEEKLLATTAYESVNEELRRRYIARVVPFYHGVALNVTAEYQRRDHTGEEVLWVAAEDPYTQRRANREEQELGGAIQARFGELGP